MSVLCFFIGPPVNTSSDYSAVINFLSEKGMKIICGGTTASVFTKHTGFTPSVDLSTACDNIPPFGTTGIITTTEGTITIKKLNDYFFSAYKFKNAVGYIKKQIKNADYIKLYIGRAVNPVNGIEKKSIIDNFIRNIKDSGIFPEIVEY